MTNKPQALDEQMIERAARAMCFADYDIAPDAYDEFWDNPQSNPWLMQEADEWANGVLVRLGRAGYRRHAAAAHSLKAAKVAELKEALSLWLAYDDQDEADFAEAGPMLLYARAIEATRAALAPHPEGTDQ